MIDINNFVRDNVKSLKPYSCARDDFQGSEGVFLDANENPFGTLNRYPDPYQRELKAEISKIKGIAEKNIFLGNGSDEIIDLCYRVFCNPGVDKVLLFPPTYGMYEVSASVNDVKVIKVPLNGNFQIDIPKVKQVLSDENLKLTFICSPNNPTGNAMNFADIEYIISNFNGIVVVDEAYIDFSNKPSLIKMIGRFPNLILMQTFSKAFGMASVRVGMAFTNPDIIAYFNKMKPPYNISTINQKAVLEKLTKTDEFKIQLNTIKEERDRLLSELNKIACILHVYPTDANFVLVKVKDANNMYNTLVNKEIIVRNRNSVISNCLRITVGTKTENNKLIKALKVFSV